ncbi:MAG TPA: SUMF1/EgtB/PvdO family nonheme iron enzyme [Polyangium sp.]|nr:SUMF1/EgtB/PvdO family nonheme iron enzyme [Polyangium sp.]
MSGTQICVQGACEVTPSSCWVLPTTCGPNGDDNRCQTELVKGGTFNRSNDPMYPATVSDFYLDRFEITVGRFRAFVEAYPIGSKPKAGDGVHPKIPGSGWDTGWPLYADANALKTAIKCDNYTWTDVPAFNENLPMDCLTWYDVFAFCAWDGGRLPTEAEWNYAAAGGNEQRKYPWGPTLDLARAVYGCLGNGNPDCVFTDIRLVGSKSPQGDAKWGHADMAGNLDEHVFDSFPDPYPMPCNDCGVLADLTKAVGRGGSWYSMDFANLETSNRGGFNKTVRFEFLGGRCARDKL